MGAPDKDEKLLSLRFPARPDQLQRVRKAVRKHVKACGCSAESTGDIVLAVDEVCQNIFRHAYRGAEGAIELEIEQRGEDLVLSLRDFAPETDPRKVKPRDLDDVRPGGIGTHLIRKVMDDAGFVPPPSGGGHLFRMVKRIG